jgi:hypothetical protein
MNRRSSGSSDCQCTSSAASHPSRLLPLPLSKALNGFTITKQAEGLSPRCPGLKPQPSENGPGLEGKFLFEAPSPRLKLVIARSSVPVRSRRGQRFRFQHASSAL